jgi:hypothetical protein
MHSTFSVIFFGILSFDILDFDITSWHLLKVGFRSRVEFLFPDQNFFSFPDTRTKNQTFKLQTTNVRLGKASVFP